MNGEASQRSVRASIEAILENQSANGAIVASPDFEQYRFCWLRDASFIAYALDRAGEHEASGRYHAWVDAAVAGIADVIDDVIDKKATGEEIDALSMPPARFALDGTTVVDDWPNFQVDGYGTWLWSLGEHLTRTGRTRVPDALRSSVERVARYLSAFAFSPCYDVWEENGDAQHTSTLACVYGGLSAAARLLDDDACRARAQEVRSYLATGAALAGYYVKSSTNDDVDASTLWLGEPFCAVEAGDEHFRATVALIEEHLTLGGGIRRYPTDVYYGSGAWPVLTASLGWHHVRAGDAPAAERCRQWIAARIDEDGRLGEQYGGEQRDSGHYRQWVQRWGHPARDLMWSHAMYVVLSLEIEATRPLARAIEQERGGV